MRVAQVTWDYTITIPDEDSDEYKALYAGWYEAEGQWLVEDGEPLPSGDDLVRSLAVYIVVESTCGDLNKYISGEDTNVAMY